MRGSTGVTRRVLGVVALGGMLSGCGPSDAETIMHESACSRLDQVAREAERVFEDEHTDPTTLLLRNVLGELKANDPSREIVASKYGPDLVAVRDRVLRGLEHVNATGTVDSFHLDTVSRSRELWSSWSCADVLGKPAWAAVPDE